MPKFSIFFSNIEKRLFYTTLIVTGTRKSLPIISRPETRHGF